MIRCAFTGCGRQFIDARGLAAHTRFFHPKAKTKSGTKVQCEHCPEIVDKRGMWRHMLKHIGMKSPVEVAGAPVAIDYAQAIRVLTERPADSLKAITARIATISAQIQTLEDERAVLLNFSKGLEQPPFRQEKYLNGPDVAVHG